MRDNYSMSFSCSVGSLLALSKDAEKVRMGKGRQVCARAFRGVIKKQYHTVKLHQI